MTCPICGGKTKVVDSRKTDVDKVWRRRECVDCKHRFNTEEYEVTLKKKRSWEE